jgi:hypothetical protein
VHIGNAFPHFKIGLQFIKHIKRLSE